MKKIYILSGGTMSHARNPLALCAPAFCGTARRLEHLIHTWASPKMDARLCLTRMAGGYQLPVTIARSPVPV